MQHHRKIGWALVVAAATVTAIRIITTIAGGAEPGATVMSMHVGLWESLMVALMSVSFVFILRVYRSTERVIAPVPEGQMANPQILNFLIGDRESCPFWTILRLYVSFAWVSAGYAKVRDETWMISGASLKHYWAATIASKPEGQSPHMASDWYHTFLTFMLDNGWYTWLAKLIAVGELAVGVLLLCGAFVGIAALFGAVLNFNYSLAGSAGGNTVVLVLGSLLVTGWMVAGYIGLDRYLLPLLGTPWHGQQEKRHRKAQQSRVT